MVNYVSQELALGKLMVPSYTPNSAPNIAEVPWPAPSADRKAAMTMWSSNRQAAKAAQPQPVHVNAWVLYQMRIISEAYICGEWDSFGGIAAQLNHLSIVLHIDTTESIGIVLTYGQLLKSHMGELARARVHDAAGVNDFRELSSNENHRFKLHVIQQHYKPPKSEPPVKTKKLLKKRLRTRCQRPALFLRMGIWGELAEDRKAESAKPS